MQQRGLRRGSPPSPPGQPQIHIPTPPLPKSPLVWHLWVLPSLENSKEVNRLAGRAGGWAGRRGGVGREERGGGRGTLAGRLGLGGKGARPSQPRGLQRIANCN